MGSISPTLAMVHLVAAFVLSLGRSGRHDWDCGVQFSPARVWRILTRDHCCLLLAYPSFGFSLSALWEHVLSQWVRTALVFNEEVRSLWASEME